MKNIALYYLAILLPLGIIIWLQQSGLISSSLLLVLVVFYVMIYRTFTDGQRLYEKGVIQKKDIWKLKIPGNFKFFRELYLP